jgi:hypothetical protein
LKPDYQWRVRRKTAAVGSGQLSGHFLWSGLLRKYRETSAFLAYFRSNAAEFLCSSDWLAEGGGFELSVRFQAVG